MNSSIKYRIYKRGLVFTGFCMLAELIAPAAAFALTGGPAQPEFSSFEPVATTNMVSEFSGDFTYNLPVLNIPGANGGGYSLSLSYHSGSSPEEEASWVGYGWSLNPGAINRGKRGFADDLNGSNVKYWNKTPANRTVSIGASAGNIEAFSFSAINLSANASLRYNNYKGFGYTAGAGVSLAKGIVSLGYDVSDGEGSFSARINPAAALEYLSKDKAEAAKRKMERSAGAMRTQDKIKAFAVKNFRRNLRGIGSMNLAGSNYGLFTYSEAMRAANVTGYKGESYNVSYGFMATPTFLQAGISIDLTGSYSWQENINSSGTSGAADAVPAYGYLYSAKAPTSGNSMMDYYTEKQQTYDKRDRYLGIPFSNADNFSVTGEGIGGGFRMYNRNAGHFRPNSKSSSIKIYNLGAEAEAGFNIGGGIDLGAGFQTLSVNNWNNSVAAGTAFLDSAAGSTINDEPYFFRFSNDQGGSVEFGSSDNAQKAKVSYVSGRRGNKNFSPSVAGVTASMNSGTRSSRSSHIAYHTNNEMGYKVNSKSYKAYTLSSDINNLVVRNSVSDGIGELSVCNEDGMRYNYGLPVYSRNELNMQYDMQGAYVSPLDSNYVVYRDISDDSKLKTKVGEENPTPYASGYLLTDITTADYVDRTFDGPSDDDWGGWTRLSYKRTRGTYNKTDASVSADSAWYKWRTPYNGLLYNRGELSTVQDDMGSVVYGEKEIYYLDTIDTKTHYAVFYTSTRDDGYDAAANNTAANGRTAKGAAYLQKLDSIKLFSKNDGSVKLIRTIRFAYDYTLSSGLPNSANSNTGKLTLKKVWFEYYGIAPAKISPYIFEYTYPGNGIYPSKYSTLDDYGNGKEENPKYSYFGLDGWGNHQAWGGNRSDSLRNWVNQNPPAYFDPAAWQLKVIKLPSGGEIHVQYEQDDYLWVQDKPVHAMISLKSNSSETGYSSAKYYLNVADLGITEGGDPLNNQELIAIKKKINDLYVGKNGEKKIYFKFLYSLIGTASPTIKKCSSEYIKGYSNVKKCDIDAGGIYLTISTSGDGKKADMPRYVCLDYLRKERAGNLSLSGNCDGAAAGFNFNAGPEKIPEQLVGWLSTLVIPADAAICAAVNYGLSYLRIPLPATRAKKGGGIRVKRILMYDKGMETGDEVLYGSEYNYQNADGSSSGAATNEPSSFREENALIDFDPNAKSQQSFINKVIAGRDKEQHELPLGESVLPSPSVGYGRIVIKNIHSGKTTPGVTVKEFFTAKDYPVKVEYTAIQTEKDYLPVPGGFINLFYNNLWMSQGFVFKLNNMHGQPKSEETYAGDPSGSPLSGTKSSAQYFTYFEPGEKVPMMGSLNSIVYANPGKESEVVFEMRGVEDISKDIAVEFDGDLGLAFIPLPFISFFPSYTYTESKMYTHVTTKMIQYPAILKSTLSMADGIYHFTENTAFDPNTGKSVLTKTTDGFDRLNLELSTNHQGVYLDYKFPAARQYSTMGQKAKNERTIIKSSSSTVRIAKQNSGSTYYLLFIGYNGHSTCEAMGRFCPGDLIKLYDESTGADRGIFHVSDSIADDNIFILPTAAYGTESTISYVNVEVLRSGCTNQLSNNAGGFTTYRDSSSLYYVSASQLELRKLFVQRLNTFYSTISLPGSGVFPQDSIPSGLKVIDVYGSCDSTNTKTITLVNEYVNGVGKLKMSFQVGGQGFKCDNTIIGKWKGHFEVDEYSHKLVYRDPGNMCYGKDNPCVIFCPDGNQATSTKVVQANAQTYHDNWPYDSNVFPVVASSNKYENGAKGKWRMSSNFVYRDTIIWANRSSERIYKDAGVFTLQVFNWKDTTQNDVNKWVRLSTVMQYSPDGNAMEEKDILNIYSAAKFGYNGTQPILVAKNAAYQDVQFESFEKLYTDKFEDGWDPSNTFVRETTVAHAGIASLKLQAGFASSEIDLKPLKITQQMIDNGLLMKVWVKDTLSATPDTAVKGRLDRSSPSASVTANFKKVARTGAWTLYEARITGLGSTFSTGDLVTPFIGNNYSSGNSIWIDDIRVQPLDAQMMAYVYDVNTLRLIATFDDQHFGLYYQYNGEGKLVRKIIETEKGIKTITETQYHSPTVQR